MKALIRWLCYSVIAAFLPIGASWLFLPRGAEIWDAAAHGELAVLAQALAAGSIGVLFERGRPRWDFELLVVLNILVLFIGAVLLCGVVGGAKQLTSAESTITTAYLLAMAILVGMFSNVTASERA